MKLRFNLLAALLLLGASLLAQSTLDQVLAAVKVNNKTIQAGERRIEAGKALFQTGLSLPDPSISFDWMLGVPSAAGNQTDLIVAQGFDFPTVYKYRRELAGLKTGQSGLNEEQILKEVLLEAKLTALHLVYLNKHKAEMERRLASTQQFYSGYQKKLEQQDATIIDVNKARLQLLNLQTSLQLLEVEITGHLQELAVFNGGISVEFTDTIYPFQPDLPDFEMLKQTIEQNDPRLRFLNTQQQIGEAETRLTRALLMPKFEAGYRYQGLLDQQFHGIHAGISLPLWENKKRIASSELQVGVYSALIDKHRTEYDHEIERLYTQYRAFHRSIQDYRTNLGLVSNQAFLDKALEAGQITVLEYFTEISLYYESLDRYLALEAMMHKTVARLMKFY